MTAKRKKLSELDTREILSVLAKGLEAQANLLETLIPPLVSESIFKLIFLTLGISSNAKSILLLARKNHGSEAYMMIRPFLEKVITFYYLQACDKTEYQNYIDYSNQKTIWKMERSIRAGDFEFNIKHFPEIDLEKFPELESAKNKYTSKAGKPKTRWSQTSLAERLGVIEKSKIIDIQLLLIATLSFYDDASEALHATAYGCTFHHGFFQPGANVETTDSMSEFYRSGLINLFHISRIIMGQLCKYICKKCDIPDVAEKSKALDDACWKVLEPYMAAAKKNKIKKGGMGAKAFVTKLSSSLLY